MSVLLRWAEIISTDNSTLVMNRLRDLRLVTSYYHMLFILRLGSFSLDSQLLRVRNYFCVLNFADLAFVYKIRN